jgi:hypothetical protein
MVVLELVESIEYPKDYLHIVDPDILRDHGSKILLEMGVPKLMLVFSVVVVLGQVEGFDDLDGFNIREGDLLSCQLINKKLNVLLTAISDATIQSSENRSHGILSTVSSNIRL